MIAPKRRNDEYYRKKENETGIYLIAGKRGKNTTGNKIKRVFMLSPPPPRYV
jgi:hypothetical protein